MSIFKDLLQNDYDEKDTIGKLEEKLNAKGFKIADLSSGKYVSAEKYSALESDLNKTKAELSSKMTESEKNEEQAKRDKVELAKFRYKENLKTIGDDEIRDKIADLYANGQNEQALSMANDYYSSVQKKYEDEIKSYQAHQDKDPKNDGAGKGERKLSDLSMEEADKLSITNPDLYEKLLAENK